MGWDGRQLLGILLGGEVKHVTCFYLHPQKCGSGKGPTTQPENNKNNNQDQVIADRLWGGKICSPWSENTATSTPRPVCGLGCLNSNRNIQNRGKIRLPMLTGA